MNVAYRYPPLADPTERAETRPASRHAPGRIARIEIVNDFSAAEAPWRRLAAQDPIATPYQNYHWIALWQKHVGALEGMRPFIVIGYDAGSEPLFVLPLARLKVGPITTARFFGGKHANLNMAVWRRDLVETITAAEMEDTIARISDNGIDVLMLFNQPEKWNGVANPLALLPHQPSAADNFQMKLIAPGTLTIKRQLSATMRGRLRTKERKLQKLKGYRYVRATSPADVDRFLDAFFVQKSVRLQQQGLPNVFARPGIESFLRAACHEGLEQGRPVIEVHALEAEGELLALFSGAQDGYRFTAMFNSYTLGENARWSPGLILLMHLVASCADRGIKSFDIGLGDARYKSFFCKEREPLFDSFLALSPRGRLLTAPLRMFYALKRRIKNSPLIWNSLKAARQKLAGREASSP